MTVTLAFDPEADPDLRQAVLDLHAPSANQISLPARPGMRRGTMLYADRMSSVGRFLPGASGATRAPNDSALLAMCWLPAMGIERVIVVDAGMLHGVAVHEACQALVGAGLDVVLCADARMGRRWRRVVKRWSVNNPDTPATYEEVADRHRPPGGPVARRRKAVPLAARCVIDLNALPYTSYLTFRADLRGHLSSDEFEIADSWYLDTFQHALRADLSEMEEVAAAIEHGYAAAEGEAGAVIAIKAVQAAAFRQGIHVDLKVSPIVAALHTKPRAEDWNSDDWEAVLAHHHPARGAAAALWAVGLAPSEIKHLRTSDVAHDGRTATVGARTVAIPPEAWAVVVAQRLYQTVMLGEGFLLFANRFGNLRNRWLDDTLNEVSAVLGRPLRLSARELVDTCAGGNTRGARVVLTWRTYDANRWFRSATSSNGCWAERSSLVTGRWPHRTCGGQTRGVRPRRSFDAGRFSRLCDALGVAPTVLLPGGGREDRQGPESSLVGQLLRALVGGDGHRWRSPRSSSTSRSRLIESCQPWVSCGTSSHHTICS